MKVENPVKRRSRVVYAQSSLQFLLFLFGLDVFGILPVIQLQLGLPSGTGAITNCGSPAESLESLMECPLYYMLNRRIEQERQRWNSCKSQTNRPPRPNPDVLEILHCATRISYNAMNRERWEAHACNALEDRSLHHDCPIIIQGGNNPRLRTRWYFLPGGNECCRRGFRIVIPGFVGDSAQFRMEGALVSAVCFVALMRHITD